MSWDDKEEVRVQYNEDDPEQKMSLEMAARMLRIFRKRHPFIFVRVWGEANGVDLDGEPVPARQRKPRGQ